MPDGITFPTLTRLVHPEPPRPADYAARSSAESEVRARPWNVERFKAQRALIQEAERIVAGVTR